MLPDSIHPFWTNSPSPLQTTETLSHHISSLNTVSGSYVWCVMMESSVISLLPLSATTLPQVWKSVHSLMLSFKYFLCLTFLSTHNCTLEDCIWKVYNRFCILKTTSPRLKKSAPLMICSYSTHWSAPLEIKGDDFSFRVLYHDSCLCIMLSWLENGCSW